MIFSTASGGEFIEVVDFISKCRNLGCTSANIDDEEGSKLDKQALALYFYHEGVELGMIPIDDLT